MSPAPCLAVTTRSAEETAWRGEQLGRLLQLGDVVLLEGPYGAGKTCFTQGLARGLGYTGYVTSPSFTLANVYEPLARLGVPLYHLDLYRIQSPAEAWGIGLEEYLAGNGICVIEWPEPAGSFVPGDHLAVRLTLSGDSRQIELCATGPRSTDIIDQLKKVGWTV